MERHQLEVELARPVPIQPEGYRPCLMVADTSDQEGSDVVALRKARRPRTCFSDDQLKELERRFRINKLAYYISHVLCTIFLFGRVTAVG